MTGWKALTTGVRDDATKRIAVPRFIVHETKWRRFEWKKIRLSQGIQISSLIG